jgi:hypothetical protein
LSAKFDDNRHYLQDDLQTSCWVVQLRLQPLLPDPAGFASVAAVVGTQVLWQFMACVSQLSVQVVNVDPDGSNWGVGWAIGATTPVPSGGSGDCICDWSGGRPGDRPVDGGGWTLCCCWASALPVSRANPSAAIADNLSRAAQHNTATIKVSRMIAPAVASPDTTQEMGRN